MKKDKGITLIALVVTIIVLLILAGITIAILTGENGLIGESRFAEFATEMDNLKEELEQYKASKLVFNRDFRGDTVSADKSTLFDNTKSEEEANAGDVFDCLPSLGGSKYESNIEVTKGKIIFISQDKKLLNMAIRANVDIDPYLIIDGELMSSDVNLFLMDESGTVVVPDRVTKIGAGAFRDLEGLRTIVIPGTVKEIADYAFSANKTLENVYIKEGLEKIGNFAFESCTSLRNVELPNTLKTIGNSCFLSCTNIEEINIPGSVTTLPSRIVHGCTKLTNIILNEGLEAISLDCFNNTKIAKLTLPSTINYLEFGAMYRMFELREIIIPSSNQFYKFQDGMLLSKDEKELFFVAHHLTSITFPEKLEVLRQHSLLPNSNLKAIHITKNIKRIDTSFHGSVKSFTVDTANTSFSSIDGNLYNYSGETLYKYCKNESMVRLPDGVKTLKSNSFINQNNVREIILPDSLETIQYAALTSTSITHLHLPKNVRGVSGSTLGFLDMTISVANDNPYFQSANDIYLLSKDGKTLVAITKNLDTYAFPSSVETIGTLAFYNKTNLKNIILPNHIKTIEDTAFDNCTSLRRIEISSNIQTIGLTAFARCDALRDIVIDKKQNEIANAPWGCPFGLRAIKWKQ